MLLNSYSMNTRKAPENLVLLTKIGQTDGLFYLCGVSGIFYIIALKFLSVSF